MLNISDIKKENFTISLEQDEKKITVIFSGKIDIPNPEVIITPFLKKIDSEAVTKRYESIYFNVCKLDFINSSGIKVILQISGSNCLL